MIFPENYQEFYEQQAKRNRRDRQFGGYGAVHPFFWNDPTMTAAMKPTIVHEQQGSSGGDDRMAEWMMKQAMNQEGKGEYLAEKQQQQALKEERGMKQQFLDDARKEVLNAEFGTAYKNPKTGELTSFDELPGDEQNKIIADKARSRYQLARQAGILPQVETAKKEEKPKKKEFGGGSIRVTGEARKGDPYGKGAIAAAFNDGRLLILEPDDEGKYKGKQRVTNDKTGVSSWQPMKNSLTRDEVDALMGAAKKHTVIEANTSKNAKAVKAVTTTPELTKVDIEKKSKSGNMLPSGSAIGSAAAETAKDMLYRSYLKSNLGRTLDDMFYQAPKAALEKALTPSEEQEEFRMQQAREADFWDKIKKGSGWLSKQVLGGLAPNIKEE